MIGGDALVFWLAYAALLAIVAAWLYGTASGARAIEWCAAPDPEEVDAAQALEGQSGAENTTPHQTTREGIA